MILFCYVLSIQKTDLNFGRVCLLPAFHMYLFMFFTKLTPASSDMVSPMATTYQTSAVFYEITGSKRTDVAS